MNRNLDEAKFVLMVCTETYRRRVLGLEEPGRGLGVDFEGNLIYNQIYHRIQNDQPRGWRFIPILLPGSEPAQLVSGLTAYFQFYDEDRPHQSLDSRTPGEVYRAGVRARLSGGGP